MNLHPYDGKERRFTHKDIKQGKGLSIINDLLGFEPQGNGLLYDLSFYSGGIGVIDKLAITFPASYCKFEVLKNKLEILSPEDAGNDEFWSEDFIWLVEDEALKQDIRVKSINFINENKLPFQATCTANSDIFFVKWSDVNDWTVIWIDSGVFNYAAFSQG